MFKLLSKKNSTTMFIFAFALSFIAMPELASAQLKLKKQNEIKEQEIILEEDDEESKTVEIGGRIRAGYMMQFNNNKYPISAAIESGDPYEEYSTVPKKTGFGFDDMRIKAEGTVGKFEFEFEFELENANGDTTLGMKDMYIRLQPIKLLNLQLGQFKIPYSRHRMVATGKQIQNGRADQIKELVPGREAGIMADYTIDMVKVYGGWFNGNGDNYSETSEASDIGMFVGRVEVSPFGKMKKQEGGMVVNNFQVMVGLSTLYNVQDSWENNGEKLNKTFNTPGTQTMYGGDITLRYLGGFLNFESHHISFKANTDGDYKGDSDLDFKNYSYLSQAGYYIPISGFGIEGIEPSLRYASTIKAADLDPKETQTTIGFGFNVYIDGNDLKLQIDYKHNLSNEALDADITAGAESGWDNNELNIMMQLAF